MNAKAVLKAVASRWIPRRWVHACTRGFIRVAGRRRFDSLMGRGHRYAGYRLLGGAGIEIGALHAPAPLPRGCTVRYLDAITPEQARALFPEIDAARLVPLDQVVDLDAGGLERVADASCDFAVLNHVIEHVANPVRVVEELFRVVRPGGHVVVSAPDMRFTFDRARALTPFEHLEGEYRAGVRHVADDHYEDLVRATAGPQDPEALRRLVAEARARREHAHVWDSTTFRDFLTRALAACGATGALRYESTGDANGIEHFSVWQRLR